VLLATWPAEAAAVPAQLQSPCNAAPQRA